MRYLIAMKRSQPRPRRPGWANRVTNEHQSAGRVPHAKVDGRRLGVHGREIRMIKGFKDFIMKGNVLDLAVAVVIGAAFTAIVTAVVTGFINPLIAAIFGKP